VTGRIRVTLPAHEPPAPTRASAEAAATLGYLFDERPAAARRDSSAAVAVETGPGALTLVLGPSGAGKSSLLTTLRDAALQQGRTVADPARVALADRPAVDLVRRAARCGVAGALALLSDAGLAEAGCLVRRPRELSAGQRERLRVALALAALARRSHRTPLLVADEFAAILDSACARSLAVTLARAVRGLGAAAVIATPRDDLVAPLAPTTIVRLDARGRAASASPDPADCDPADAHEIAPGSMADYAELARHHYRAGRPARPSRVLAARDVRTGALAGALVECFPTLNGAWREWAWPGVFTGPDRRASALRLNAQVRRIARVVVEPAHRGAGLAQRLVERALATADTPCAEAVAALGRFSSFFERAGMTRYDLPLRPRDARLLDALDHLGVEPWRLATPEAALARARRAAAPGFVEDELRRWSRSRGDPGRAFRDACRRLGCRMSAFAAGSPAV